MSPDGAAVREVDLVALPFRRRTQSRPEDPPRPENHPPPAPGFELVEIRFEDTFTLLRYQAPEPVMVIPVQLGAVHIELERRSAVFFED
jgi:hypothetical protein